MSDIPKAELRALAGQRLLQAEAAAVSSFDGIVKTLILINGGGLVALASLVGALGVAYAIDLSEFTVALLLLGLGLILAVMAAIMGWLPRVEAAASRLTDAFTSGISTKGIVPGVFATIAVMLSLASFAGGILAVAAEFDDILPRSPTAQRP